jgi:ABC-type branched-subunit amino acid transport system substrate-binding protein
MMRSENPSDFFGTLKSIFQSTTEEEPEKQKNADRLILRQSVLAFLGNLCSDAVLRLHIASNM